jgi:hypothetical protein
MNRLLRKGTPPREMPGFMSMKSVFGTVVFAAIVCSTALAAAQPRDDSPFLQPQPAAEVGAFAGQFLPTTLSARTDSQRGYFLAFAGYDSARKSAQSEALVDVSILSWLAVRGGFLYTQHPNRTRPTIGVRAQPLSQENVGIDLGVGAYYRPEGFTEGEGEIELVVAVGRRFGRLATFANLVYGQDPEAAERDGEVRLAALYAVTQSVQAGFDARLRADLGSEEGKRRAEGGAEYDLVFGPTASYAIGPIAVIAQGGMSVFGTNPAKPGGVIQLGIAGAI